MGPPTDIDPQQLPILCGLDLTQHIVMTPKIWSELAAAANSTTTAMSAHDEPRHAVDGIQSVDPGDRGRDAVLLRVHHDEGHGYVAHLHDPLAAAVALDPALVATRTATVDVELAGTLTRGMTVADWSGRWGRNPTRTSVLASTLRRSSIGSSNGSDRSRVG